MPQRGPGPPRPRPDHGREKAAGETRQTLTPQAGGEHAEPPTPGHRPGRRARGADTVRHHGVPRMSEVPPACRGHGFPSSSPPERKMNPRPGGGGGGPGQCGSALRMQGPQGVSPHPTPQAAARREPASRQETCEVADRRRAERHSDKHGDRLVRHPGAQAAAAAGETQRNGTRQPAPELGPVRADAMPARPLAENRT